MAPCDVWLCCPAGGWLASECPCPLRACARAPSQRPRRAAEEQRRAMLVAVMMPEARERREQTGAAAGLGSRSPPVRARRTPRLDEPRPAKNALLSRAPPPAPTVARIALVKPDKARSIENMILSAAQRGAITEKARRGTRGRAARGLAAAAAAAAAFGAKRTAVLPRHRRGASHGGPPGCWAGVPEAVGLNPPKLRPASRPADRTRVRTGHGGALERHAGAAERAGGAPEQGHHTAAAL
jgi:DNA-binding TFAR19-related protein (PDSD5 family)